MTFSDFRSTPASTQYTGTHKTQTAVFERNLPGYFMSNQWLVRPTHTLHKEHRCWFICIGSFWIFLCPLKSRNRGGCWTEWRWGDQPRQGVNQTDGHEGSVPLDKPKPIYVPCQPVQTVPAKTPGLENSRKSSVEGFGLKSV